MPHLWGNWEGSFWGWNNNSTQGGIRLQWYVGSANTSIQNLTTDSWTTGTAISGNMGRGAAVGNFQVAVININDGTDSNPVWNWSTNTVYSSSGWGPAHPTAAATGNATFGVFGMYNTGNDTYTPIKFIYSTLAWSYAPVFDGGEQNAAFGDSTYGHFMAFANATGSTQQYEWSNDTVSSDTTWPVYANADTVGAAATSNSAGAIVVGQTTLSATSVTVFTRQKATSTYTGGPTITPPNITSSNSLIYQSAAGNETKANISLVYQNGSSASVQAGYDIAFATTTVTTGTTDPHAQPSSAAPISTSSSPAWF